MGKKLPFKYNVKPGKIGANELLFRDHFSIKSRLPKQVDLRDNYPSIENQGDLGACTAFSACAVLAYLLNKSTPLSKLYFYYKERQADGTVGVDAGSSISRSAIVATTIGACIEKLWPYVTSTFCNAPTPSMDADAKNHKALKRYAVTDIDDVLYAVGVLKKPVLIGVDVYESFEDIGKDGYIPMPKRDEQLLGGHALNIAGYFYKKDDNIISSIFNHTKYKGLYLIIRNSWGTDFGDKGYLYMPAEFLLKYSSDWWYLDMK